MKKNLNFTLILVIITCATIEGSHLFHRRLQAESITLKFTKAYNLIFGDDSKWKFDINYEVVGPSSLSTSSTYTVSILYNEQTKYASCTVASTSLLNCILNESNTKQELNLSRNLYNINIIKSLNATNFQYQIEKNKIFSIFAIIMEKARYRDLSIFISHFQKYN